MAALVRVEGAEHVRAELARVPIREEHFEHVDEGGRVELPVGTVYQEALVPVPGCMGEIATLIWLVEKKFKFF